MKTLVSFSFCIALATGLLSCNKGKPAGYVPDGTDPLSIPQETVANTASGVITDETSMNVISIATPEGDTMRIGKGDAVVEGSGIIIGDSAVVYYFFEASADSTGNRPVASRIVTKQVDLKK